MLQLLPSSFHHLFRCKHLLLTACLCSCVSSEFRDLCLKIFYTPLTCSGTSIFGTDSNGSGIMQVNDQFFTTTWFSTLLSASQCSARVADSFTVFIFLINPVQDVLSTGFWYSFLFHSFLLVLYKYLLTSMGEISISLWKETYFRIYCQDLYTNTGKKNNSSVPFLYLLIFLFCQEGRSK